MAYVDELFAALKKSNTAKEVEESLMRLQHATENDQIIQIANETLQLLQNFIRQLLERKEFKKAANQYYLGAKIYQTYLKDQNSANAWYREAANNMLKAAQEHVDWKDLEGGAACVAISAILRILGNDDNFLAPIDEFVKRGYFAQGNEVTSGCIYIPYELHKALAELDASSYQRADSYSQTYLLTQKTSVPFKEAIYEALNKVKAEFLGKIKQPHIQAKIEHSLDLVFGEEFTLYVEVTNTGEGIARNLTAEIKIPQELQLLDGVRIQKMAQFQPQQQLKFPFKLMCPTGEGKPELTLNFEIAVSYYDVLNNQRNLTLGPYSLTIKAFKRSDELRARLEKNKQLLQQKTGDVNINPNAAALNTFWTAQRNTIEALFENTATLITQEKFDHAESLLDAIETIYLPQIEEHLNFVQQNNQHWENIAHYLPELLSYNQTLEEKLNNLITLLDDKLKSN